MLVFIVRPTIPNSSMALVISVIAASVLGIGVAANARKRSGCADTSAAYSSFTWRAAATARSASPEYGSCGAAESTCKSMPARSINFSRAVSSSPPPAPMPRWVAVSDLPSATSMSR
jgi:hypothetical protein